MAEIVAYSSPKEIFVNGLSRGFETELIAERMQIH
jgi:hypothetical protein